MKVTDTHKHTHTHITTRTQTCARTHAHTYTTHTQTEKNSSQANQADIYFTNLKEQKPNSKNLKKPESARGVAWLDEQCRMNSVGRGSAVLWGLSPI